MQIKEQSINGIFLIKPKIFHDSRGFFFECYNNKKIKHILGNKKFVQSNHSYSKKNVLRGIHFQIFKPQFQLFYLIKGELDVFLVDLRPNSQTFKKNIYLNLKSELHYQILSSPGIGTAFYTKKNENIVIYYVSEFYEPKNEMGIIWNDKTLNLRWNCNKPIISKKDLSNIQFDDIKFNQFKTLQKLK